MKINIMEIVKKLKNNFKTALRVLGPYFVSGPQLQQVREGIQESTWGADTFIFL